MKIYQQSLLLILIITIYAYNQNVNIPKSDFHQKIETHELNFDWKAIIKFIIDN